MNTVYNSMLKLEKAQVQNISPENWERMKKNVAQIDSELYKLNTKTNQFAEATKAGLLSNLKITKDGLNNAFKDIKNTNTLCEMMINDMLNYVRK